MVNETRVAIAVHHTPTSEERWDGPGNKARLRKDETASYYRQAYAWRDANSNPDTKDAYKFIHHQVSANGDIGAANVKACQAGISVLNGARGGTTIPDRDRQGVWNHLAAHLRDAEVEPPPLRSLDDTEMEHRSFTISPTVERREDGKPRIVGHAAVFNELSLPMFFFREKIKPGAFAKTLDADIRALFNHDSNLILGRTKNSTLKLSEDTTGLRMEIDPPDTTWAKDVVTLIERGDVDQASFGFVPIKQTWDESGPEVIRQLEEVELIDVSIVTFPAYPQTDVQVRNGIQRVLNGYFSERQSQKELENLKTANAYELSNLRRRLELKSREV